MKNLSDGSSSGFGTPYGLCALNENKLLVSIFDQDCVVLTDFNGMVHKRYQSLVTPKDVQISPKNTGHALVSIQKGLVYMDIETGAIIRRSNLKLFYPWKIQSLHEKGLFLGKFFHFHFYFS